MPFANVMQQGSFNDFVRSGVIRYNHQSCVITVSLIFRWLVEEDHSESRPEPVLDCTDFGATEWLALQNIEEPRR